MCNGKNCNDCKCNNGNEDIVINVLDVVFEKNSDCVISELSGTRCESCAGGRCEYLDKLNEN